MGTWTPEFWRNLRLLLLRLLQSWSALPPLLPCRYRCTDRYLWVLLFGSWTFILFGWSSRRPTRIWPGSLGLGLWKRLFCFQMGYRVGWDWFGGPCLFAHNYFVIISMGRSVITLSPPFIFTPGIWMLVGSGGSRVCWLFTSVVLQHKLILHRSLSDFWSSEELLIILMGVVMWRRDGLRLVECSRRGSRCLWMMILRGASFLFFLLVFLNRTRTFRFRVSIVRSHFTRICRRDGLVWARASFFLCLLSSLRILLNHSCRLRGGLWTRWLQLVGLAGIFLVNEEVGGGKMVVLVIIDRPFDRVLIKSELSLKFLNYLGRNPHFLAVIIERLRLRLV